MTSPEALEKQRQAVLDGYKREKEGLQDKIRQTEESIGKGASWKDAQFLIEKYKEEIRVLDNKILKMQLGEDVLSELKIKKQQLHGKMQMLEDMKKSKQISDSVYKEKKKDIEKETQQVERDIVESM